MRTVMKLVVLTLLASAGTAGLAQGATNGFEPVTTETLLSPSPDDWMMWRRTYDATGYSPLEQITAANVSELELVWAYAMQPGTNEATPIVYGGVMYLAHPGDVITALDAATGDLLWEYRRVLPDGAGVRQTKTIALYDDKVIHATGDAHVIALDASSGQLVWETAVADFRQGYGYTAGPLIVNGMAITGMSGCGAFYQGNCFITAHDAENGEELWRTSTIARQGTPGGDTWGDLPDFARGGGESWITGSYDPELDLIYWPVSQAKPWARVTRGTDGATLYTDSTLALNPSTGEIVWYHQYVAGETLDQESAFEAILIDDGERRLLYNMGKHAILTELDRETGAFLGSHDLGYQDVFDSFDPVTGQLNYREDVIPAVGEEVQMCPDVAGFKSWRAMSYVPDVDAFIVPLRLVCGSFVTEEMVDFVEGGGGVGAPWAAFRQWSLPGADGNVGEVLAMDRTTGEVLWRHRQRAPVHTGILATAGGVTFVGDWNRYLYAFETSTGDQLWSTRLASSPHGFITTYAVDGRQYIAVPAGNGWIWAQGMSTIAPEMPVPPVGNSIFVFALPAD